jgi:hypothetical protein
MVLSHLRDAEATPEELERMKKVIAEASADEYEPTVDAPEEA